MKPDLYTKIVLTVISVMLTVLACNQYVTPAATAQAQASQFAGVQYSTANGTPTFFDSRTGEIWALHDADPGLINMETGKFGKLAAPPRWVLMFKIAKLGGPITEWEGRFSQAK